ncbi:ABC-type transport auxiliary lipoprotein family protein [Sphingobium boeckii]|uniref:Cholesterol transport system auxiliary component n=1 Tax=Sphingobium boeckii TaxID=1082345 RepID=A0A7W9AIQ9_9SPHN|nr:ABC-type transport auxiliary lipoprotein family protein [Sphingobium boeckii]MBB5686414.1 cholesterol transport system auxiliary component [Sphingobium boeckii]
MRQTPTAIALAATLALTGCISFGAKPPPSLLMLTAQATMGAGQSRTAGAGEAVTIITPTTPAALATNRVPVQADDTNIAYIDKAQWVDVPAKMFQQLVSETVAAKTGRVVLDARQFSFDPGVRVTGELSRFGLDARAMEAVVTYDAAKSGVNGTRVEERRFEARVPVSAIEAGPAGAALNQAANQVAAEVAAWIGG